MGCPSAAQPPRIWVRWAQGAGALNESGSGLGLGLGGRSDSLADSHELNAQLATLLPYECNRSSIYLQSSKSNGIYHE